jgi:DNA-binding NtrC family response regulator
VTDFAMPELNGIDLLMGVRAAGITCPPSWSPAFADGAFAGNARAAKVHSMMEKPIELRAFVEMVGAVLAAH